MRFNKQESGNTPSNLQRNYQRRPQKIENNLADEVSSINEKILNYLAYLRSKPGNRACYDCGSLNPLWAYVKYSKFVCTECAAKYRKKGVKVKNTILDVFDEDEARRMSVGGSNIRNIDDKVAESRLKYPGYSFMDVTPGVNKEASGQVVCTTSRNVRKNSNVERHAKKVSNILGIVETDSSDENEEEIISEKKEKIPVAEDGEKIPDKSEKKIEYKTATTPYRVKKGIQLGKGTKKYTLESKNEVIPGIVDVDENNDNEVYSYKNITNLNYTKNSSKSEIIEDMIDSIKTASKEFVGNVINKFKRKN